MSERATMHGQFESRARLRRWAVSVVGACLFVACVEDDPCDPGQLVVEGFCYDEALDDGDGTTDCYPGSNEIRERWEAEDAATPSDSGEGGMGGGASARICANWGADCAVQGDCVGGLFCGAEEGFPICTQGFCAEGQLNEGICPPDFTCITIGGQSGCTPQ